MTNYVIVNDKERHFNRKCVSGINARVSAMLNRLGIESRLQLAITVCVMALIIVTTIGSGGPTWVFLTYRTLALVIALLSTIGTRQAGLRISPIFLACTAVLFALMLI